MEGLPHPTSILHFLYLLKVPKWIPEPIFFSWGIIIFLSLFFYFATKRFERVPTRTQVVLETLYEGLNNFTKNIITHNGERFTPLIGTFFIYILIMNLLGLIPGMLSPTANYNTTISLAIVTFVVVIYVGIRERGVKAFINYLAGGLLEGPIKRILAFSPLIVIMIICHLISDFFAKPFSLSIRLFVNIFSKETALIFLILLLPAFIKFVVPGVTYLFIVLLGVLTSFLQALIFSLLSAVYIEIITSEH